MTPKLLARIVNPKRRYSSSYTQLVTEQGDKFSRIYQHTRNFTVGEVVWLAKRLNLPSHEWCYEIYQVTLEQAIGYREGIPKIWFGRDRHIVEKIL